MRQRAEQFHDFIYVAAKEMQFERVKPPRVLIFGCRFVIEVHMMQFGDDFGNSNSPEKLPILGLTRELKEALQAIQVNDRFTFLCFRLKISESI